MIKSAFLTTTLLLIAFGVTNLATAQQRREPPLTNASIVKLVRAGFKDKTVIAIINSRPSRFELGPDRLIELKRSGVSENVIRAMLAQYDSTFVVNDDGWDDDAFFGNEGRSKPSPSGDSQSPQTDIFGSSGGSNSRSRQGGLNGSSQGDTVTTGSATVRILRPPTEAGGAPLKLEKTPTLDNDAIIRLVEAGFSEGTILKRIEDSPANFDLSSSKLLELKKRRVTDAIIAAMTAAMDDSDTKVMDPGTSKEN
ncbi:MAG TPA: hypothetical protein VJ124_22630 [Pyrinomonadaceae bacterium]|nr:hypothetical protein [Pyrinomonadaceae bacterium]